jgi:hypothetical protein
MAKRKKLQDQNPPRRVEIRGQDHLLAYITPEEAALLKANGGSGEAGPMGIPQYSYGDGDFGQDNPASDATAGAGPSGGRGGGGSDDFDADLADSTGAQVGTSGGGRTMSDAEIQAAIDAANQTLGPNVSEYGIASDIFGSNLFGGSYYPSGTEFGTPNYKAVTDVYNQIAQAKMYEQPIGATIMSLFNPFAALPKVQSLATEFMGPKFINALAVSGNTPIYSGGRVTGVRNQYGDVVVGRDPNADEGGAGRDGGPGNIADTRPVNPVTGQCDAGYIFDEDLQACRLDTGGVASSSPTGTTFAPGAYARMGLLDQTPQGLLQVAGQPYDFDAANKAFRMATATRPEYYSDPYDLQGYTLLA